MCFDVLMMCMWTKSSFWLPEIIIDICTGDLTAETAEDPYPVTVLLGIAIRYFALFTCFQ